MMALGAKFLGRLFGTDKALEGVVNGVSKGLDALVYTDEEKAGDAAESRSEARKMVIEWMKATQGQNLSRRLIALSVTAVWILQYMVAQICDVVSVWVPLKVVTLPSTIDGAKPVVQVINVWSQSADSIRAGAGEMSGAVMLILTFYFAAPHMGQVVTAAIGKFTGGNKNG